MLMTKIHKNLAKNIVEAVYEVCECPINFIDRNGIIVASTDESRLGEFHEAGFEVIRTGQAMIVEDVNSFKGTKPGVNYPIIMNEVPIAVIGITGTPAKVRKYGFLATKVTEVFIREQQLNVKDETLKQRMNYFIRSFIYNEKEENEYLIKLMEEFDVLSEDYFGVILLKLDRRYNLHNLSMIEKKVHQLFEELHVTMFTYVYPNEFIGWIKKENFEKSHKIIERFGEHIGGVLHIGIGNVEALNQLHVSYEQAKIAYKSAMSKNAVMQYYEELTIEMIFGGLPKQVKEQFIKRVIRGLDSLEKELLLYYFNHNLSLKETSAHFFIHINTLQYKLDKIAKKVGLNPRSFSEATILYFALIMEEM